MVETISYCVEGLATVVLLFAFFSLTRLNSGSRNFRKGWDAAKAYYESDGILQREIDPPATDRVMKCKPRTWKRES